MFARGDFADYARAATDAGVTVLGVSDHCPTPSNTATARDCGIPLEINTSGYNKPLKEDTGSGEWRAQYP